MGNIFFLSSVSLGVDGAMIIGDWHAFRTPISCDTGDVRSIAGKTLDLKKTERICKVDFISIAFLRCGESF
jgi:hypothetical protein